MAAKRKSQAGQDPTLRLQYYRSAIGAPTKHKLIIKGLGFKRLQQIVTRVDTPAVRGMVAHVPHLVKILQSENTR